TEEEVRQYFLFLTKEKKVSRSTATVALCGIKFFCQYTLGSHWPILKLVRPGKEYKLPVVLSREEVHEILGAVRVPVYRVCLTTIYSCGLRLMEGTRLRVSDIDSSRMVLHVRGGKGKRDSDVTLAERTLELLREFWKTHRSPEWMFPASARLQPQSDTGGPIKRTSLQSAV